MLQSPHEGRSRNYAAQSLPWRRCSTHAHGAVLLQEAPAKGRAATGPMHPQTWLCVCCPAVSGTHSGQLCRVTEAPAWPQPLLLPSADTLYHPPSTLRAVFCDLLFPLSGNVGRRERQMPPRMPPPLLIGGAVWIPRHRLGPSGSSSCRRTVCQAGLRAAASEGRIEPSTVTLGSRRFTALIINSSIIRSKSK